MITTGTKVIYERNSNPGWWTQARSSLPGQIVKGTVDRVDLINKAVYIVNAHGGKLVAAPLSRVTEL